MSPAVTFLDKILPSKGIVSDFESSDTLIEEADYVMDRGYPLRKNLMEWQRSRFHLLSEHSCHLQSMYKPR